MSDHAIPLEVDAAPEDHKTSFQGTMRNARNSIVAVCLGLLIVVYAFAGQMEAVAAGVLFTLGVFKFLGGRWISAVAWAFFSIVLFIVVALVRGFLV